MFQTSCVHHQEDHLYMQFLWYVFMRLCEQSSRWEDVLGTNGLPDDEHMLFETCRGQEKLN